MEKHFTATGIIVNSDRTKTLLIQHRRVSKWLSPGGHIEQNETPDEAVFREVQEETGLSPAFIPVPAHAQLRANAEEAPLQLPIAVLDENIPEHKGKPAHQHIDFIYLLECSDIDKLRGVEHAQWFTKVELESLAMYEANRKLCQAFLKE